MLEKLVAKVSRGDFDVNNAVWVVLHCHFYECDEFLAKKKGLHGNPYFYSWYREPESNRHDVTITGF